MMKYFGSWKLLGINGINIRIDIVTTLCGVRIILSIVCENIILEKEEISKPRKTITSR